MTTPIRFHNAAGALLAAMLIAGSASWAQDQDREQVEKRREVTAPSGYWVGLQLHAVPDELRAHVELPADQGLYVSEVIPDSPASAAGLKQHDILLEVDGQALKQVSDLADAVDAAQDKPLSVKLTRLGKMQTATITPAKRPAEVTFTVDVRENESARRTAVEALRHAEKARDESLHQLERARLHVREYAKRAEDAVREPLRIQFFHPGMVLPMGAAARPPFADDLSVVITKKGNTPAKVEAHKGDESWTVNEDELDKLPESVRVPVQGLLGRAPLMAALRIATEAVPEVEDSRKEPPQAVRTRPAAPPKPDARRDRMLNEIERQLQALTKQVEELRAEPRRDPRDSKDRSDRD